MTSSEVWDEAMAEHYDGSSAEMFAPDVLGPTVDFLARLAGAGPALEFAVGTGRVAIALSARGVPVTGIELSEPMVAQLRRKLDEASLPVTIGDMATTTVPGEFSLVYWCSTPSPTCAPRPSRSSASATPPATCAPAGGSSSSSGCRRSAGCRRGSQWCL